MANGDGNLSIHAQPSDVSPRPTTNTTQAPEDEIVERVAAMLKNHRDNRYADEALASDALIDRVFAEEIVAAIQAYRVRDGD